MLALSILSPVSYSMIKTNKQNNEGETMKTRKSTLINCDAIGYKEMLVGTSENGNDLIDWGEGVWEVIN